MIYNDYSEAYRLNKFDFNNVDFVTKLVVDSYVFDAAHKPNDIQPYEIECTGYLNGNDIITKSMSEIMQTILENLREEISSNFPDIMTRINRIYENDVEKSNRIQQILISDSSLELGEFWRKLKEEGIKYIVVEHPVLNILCFQEEIEA